MPEVNKRSPYTTLMQFFGYKHLPLHLQAVSKPFFILANELDTVLEDCSQKDQALNLLLQAKDCAVRALLTKS